MFLIQLIYKTLNSERKAITFYMINTAVLILIFNMLMDSVNISYPLTMSIAILFIYLCVKTYNMSIFLEGLKDAKFSKSTFQSETSNEAAVFETIEKIHTEYGEKLALMEQKLAGRNTLFTSFIHNMKSSVAVIELACSKESASVIPDIYSENEKLKTNLEQVLNVLRLDDFSNDYVPECVELRSLVSSVINEKRRDFIYAEVYPKLCEETALVYTDKKWCAYILEQIVSNAIKYNKTNSKVYFNIQTINNQVTLTIRDEGIGIEPEDVSRVFELFYTGQNGRRVKNATGIGLAMVKHIAKQLGHEVGLTSEIGVGTSVAVGFTAVIS